MNASLARSVALATLACAILAGAGCEHPATPLAASTSLEGVVHGTYGVLVGNAVVEILDSDSSLVASTVTDQDGHFSFPTPPADLTGMRLKLSTWGYLDELRPLDSLVASQGSTVDVSFTEAALCRMAKIKVTGSSAGSFPNGALAGATVRLEREGVVVRTATSDAQGFARVGGVDDRSHYVLRIEAPGYPATTTSFHNYACDSGITRKHLFNGTIASPMDTCMGMLDLRLRDTVDFDDPFLHRSGVAHVTRVGTSQTFDLPVRPTGVVMDEILAGSYEIVVEAVGYEPLTTIVSIPCGGTGHAAAAVTRQ